LSASGGFKTLYLTKAYEKNAKFSPTKTNPNEPKQTQSDPRFSLTRAPQSQNEPKQTQANPIYSEPVEPISNQRNARARGRREQESIPGDCLQEFGHSDGVDRPVLFEVFSLDVCADPLAHLGGGGGQAWIVDVKKKGRRGCRRPFGW
jgi:hypothetical protein